MNTGWTLSQVSTEAAVVVHVVVGFGRMNSTALEAPAWIAADAVRPLPFTYPAARHDKSIENAAFILQDSMNKKTPCTADNNKLGRGNPRSRRLHSTPLRVLGHCVLVHGRNPAGQKRKNMDRCPETMNMRSEKISHRFLHPTLPFWAPIQPLTLQVRLEQCADDWPAKFATKNPEGIGANN